MKLNRNVLSQLERRAAALPAPGPDATQEDEFLAWSRGGCVGPLPPAGPCPPYRQPEEWESSHRFLLALCCRGAGQPDPPGLTEAERREVDEFIAFCRSYGLVGDLPQQVRLAPYRDALETFLTDPGGGTAPEARQPAPIPEPKGPPVFKV